VRRHEADVLSLVLGLFFLGSALIWGLSDDPGQVVSGWPLPTLLIVVGVAGLAASLLRRHGDTED
jgi:integral membrane sensor domain MASE1